MASRDLVMKARAAWVAYGNALARAFGLPPDSQLAADEFEVFIKKGDDGTVEQIIVYLDGEAAGLRSRRICEAS